jgi:hypothetical protein
MYVCGAVYSMCNGQEYVFTTKKLLNLKGQCHKIFCFWFFLESVSPNPLIIPLGPFRIFSKIRGYIRSSRFASGVNDTGGNLPPVSSIPVAICHWRRWHRRQICRRYRWHRWQISHRYQQRKRKWWKNLPPVSLIPVANLPRVSPRIFEKIRNGLNGILWGWGETDSWKKPEAKNLVALSL